MTRDPLDDEIQRLLQENLREMAEKIQADPKAGPTWPRDAENARRIREEILAGSRTAEARRRAGQPTEFAPRYAELNPLGVGTEIVHVITTLEDSR